MGAFHDDLRRLLRARGLVASQASLRAGLFAGAIPRYLREGSYPLPDAFSRIAAALEAPSPDAAAWRQEAAEARPRHGHAFAARAKHRRAAAHPLTICAQCRRVFVPLDAATRFCSRSCAYRHRGAATEQANRLQKLFLAEVARRALTLKSAAAAAGCPYSTVKAWLNRADSRLRQLDAVAAFLGVTVAQAVELQGGTWAERQTHIARFHMLPAAHRWQRNKRNTKRRKEALVKAQGVRRGRPMSEDHKRKITEAILAYRQRPDAHRFGAHHRTPRGWVQQILRSLKAHYPDLTHDEREAACLQKLRAMGKPFAGRDEQVARRLIAQRSTRGQARGGRQPLFERDALIFVMRRRGDSWEAIAGAVNAVEAADHTGESLQRYYRQTPSQVS